MAFRVVEEVGQYLLEPTSINTPDGLVAGDRGDDAGGYPPSLADAPGELGDVDRSAFRGLVAAGQFDQIGDEGLEPGDLVGDEADRPSVALVKLFRIIFYKTP